MNIAELIENADNAYYATDYDNAIVLYKQALDLDPHNKHAQEQLRKAEFNKPSENIKPKDLPVEALQLYKRSRSFLAVGDLTGARRLLRQAIDIAENAGVDFLEARGTLRNIPSAFKVEEFKKKVFEDLDSKNWIKAEADLSLAIDLDPTDTTVQTLLVHLRSLLKAQKLIQQLKSSSGIFWNRSKIDKEIRGILEHTNEIPALSSLWLEVLDARSQVVSSEQTQKNVQLTIDWKFSEFEEKNKQAFIVILAGLLDIESNSIHILRIQSGSIILVLELPAVAANKLKMMVMSNDSVLKTIDLLSIQIDGDVKVFYKSEDRQPNSKVIVPKIFISYSHKDESFKDELVTMLIGLQRQGIIDTWQDRRIEPGSEWFHEIEKAMEECKIAILLVSPDFIASRFIQEVELNELLQRRIKDGLLVIPIIIRPCLWQSEPIIPKLQALPKDGKPIITFSTNNGDRDQVWSEIGGRIKDIAKDL